MKQFISGIVTVVFVLITVTLCVSHISANVQTTAAKNLKDTVVEELENSAYNASTLNECFDTVSATGRPDYQLKITVYYSDGKPAKTFTSTGANSDNMKDACMAYVELKYEYKLGFFKNNNATEHVAYGTAK
ncbi:MAG: hypothetical protein K1W06_10565 [Lachnospiraceae bacterium]|jgi:hypothetical protein